MAKEVSFLIKIRNDGGAKRVTADAEEMGRVIRSVQDEAEKAKRDVLTWSEAAQAVDLLHDSIAGLQRALTEMTADYQTSVVAQTQLATIMRQRMGSTEEEIQSIRDLWSAQQELGVVEDDIAASGAQQMATFLKEKQSLDVLIPTMNNLIAQQDGLNATVQGAVGIGNMMGKAMQGQTEVLQRVGITFDETQKQVLQFGTESERAAMLAEVITANVGNMNEELGKTDAGKQKQLENTLGDIKEQLGSMVQGAMPFVTIAAQAMICVVGCVRLVATLKALSAAFSLTTIKAVVLGIQEKMVAVGQNLLAATGYTAAAGTAALTVAMTALAAAMSMGISLAITGLISLFSSMGDEAEDAAQGVDVLKESTDAFSNASSNAKAEIDMETNSLASLINSHKNTSKKIDELNRKYGESFGYHRTAAEWYDTLVSKSKAYCTQMGYEAQAKALSSQIAAKQLEKEGRQSERLQLGQQYMDNNGKSHYNWENSAGGKEYYDQLGSQISRLNDDIAVLQRRYDSAIQHMVEAQKELDKSRKSVHTSGDSLKDATAEELKRTIEQDQQSLERLSGSDEAERQRLNREIGRLQKEVARREGVNKKEQGVVSPIKTKAKTDRPVINARTLEDVGKNISYYETQLKKTDKADTDKIKRLVSLIGKYKELKEAIEKEMAAASRPASLNTLQEIDTEIQYQQQLRRQSAKEDLGQIDAEIKRLNDLKTALEDSSHMAIGLDQIDTYEQLDAELAFYEKKLKTASAAERVEMQKRITALKKLRGEWDDTLGALDAPAAIGSLNSMEELDKAISYYGARQREATGDEVEKIQRTISALQQKRDALTRTTEIPTMQQETADLSGLQGKPLLMELKLIGLEGIREKIRSLQKMLADTQNPLGMGQRQEVQGLIDTWTRYEKTLKRSQASLGYAWNGMKGIGNGIEGLTEILEGNGNAWQAVTGIVDGTIQIYDGMNAVIGLVNALTGATQMNTAATTAQGVAKATEATIDTTATGVEVANSAARAAAAGVETTADVAGAAAKTMKAHASIPWVGIAIGAGMVAALVGIMTALPKFADGGIAYGPTLGIFGEYAGARSNPEVVAPLDKLKSIIGSEENSVGGVFRLEVQGRKLVAVLANETRTNRKRTNIRL